MRSLGLVVSLGGASRPCCCRAAYSRAVLGSVWGRVGGGVGLVDVGGGWGRVSGPERVDRFERLLEDLAVAEAGGWA
jgi:hypothetical protein